MKKSNFNIVVVIILLKSLWLMISCESDRCFHGSGKTTNKRIETGYFYTLNVQGLLHIVLIEDTMSYLEYEGGEKVLDYVEADNIDSVLWLNNTNNCFFFREYEKIRAYVHYQNLSKVNIFEVCKMESYDSLSELSSMTMQAEMAEINLVLNGDHFSFYNNRTTGGDYTFSGNVDRCWISGYYTAKFNTRDLVVRDFYVNNSSLSDMYINALERLQVKILHRGNIYYSGSPEIIVDSLSGTGQLLPWTETN